MKIQGIELVEGKHEGEPVVYLPPEANGDRAHAKVEFGKISSWNDMFVFVKFEKYGINARGQAVSPHMLEWD